MKISQHHTKSELRKQVVTLFQSLTLLCLWALGVSLIFGAGYLVSRLPYGFDTDEFLHAAPALDFAVLWSRGAYRELLIQILQQSFYPPLYPMVVSFGFLLTEPTVVSARLPSLLIFLLSVLFLFFAVYRLLRNTGAQKSESRLAASVAALLAISSPVALLNSSLCMIESTGMLLTSFVLWVIADITRGDNEYLTPRSAFLVGTALALSALTKYTFPVLLLPGLFFSTLLLTIIDWKQFKARVYWSVWTGMPGAILGLLWFSIADYEQISRFLFDYPARGSIIGITTLLYYPFRFIEDYNLFRAVGLAALFFAILGAFKAWSNFSVRTAAMMMVFSLLILGFTSERQPRHILAVVPSMWMLAGVGAAVACTWCASRRLTLLPWLLVLAWVITIPLVLKNNLPWIHTQFSRIMERNAPLDEFVEAVLPGLDTSKTVLLYNGRGAFLPFYLDWRVAAKGGLTMAEARTIRVSVNRDEQERLRNTAFTGPDHVTRELKQLWDEYRFGSMVLIKERGERDMFFESVREHYCKNYQCRIRMTSILTFIQLSNVTSGGIQ